MVDTLSPKELLQNKGMWKPTIVAVKVNGQLGDVHTPVPMNADITTVEIDSPEALEVIRHSSAHVMADAVQRLFPGTQVTIGPSIDSGFYYDFYRPEGAFSDDDLVKIEDQMKAIIHENRPFVRQEVSREEAHRFFESMGEHYKLELLAAAQEPITLYRHGNWVDLCRGPHVPSTGFLQAIKLISVAGAYWRGDERNAMLQRIYGTAFATQIELDEYLKRIEEAKQRDHRKLGKELDLFSFHPWAPASPFFLPRGAFVYNALVDYVRTLYRKYDYKEVITPQVFDAALYRTSGHIPEYEDNMFFAATLSEHADDGSEKKAETKPHPSSSAYYRYGLKPMNCPAHALLFGSERRSYRELPLRMADFGRLHRFERSGVTQGLTRVRTFCQDDAHIFCTLEQIEDELLSFNRLVMDVYKDFAFTDVSVVVATRPEKRIGSDELWDHAENALRNALTKSNVTFTEAAGEGAFYGPKIEYHLKDALGRSWQLGTMQVDPNLPERFDLNYVGQDNQSHRPIMLHRAILGSIERFFGVLVEHVGGAFPTWLAPEQIYLATVSDKFNDYAEHIRKQLTRAGVRVHVDHSQEKIGAKIRKAALLKVPYVGVIGQREVDAQSLAIRMRNQDLGALPVKEVQQKILAEALPPSLRHEGGN